MVRAGEEECENTALLLERLILQLRWCDTQKETPRIREVESSIQVHNLADLKAYLEDNETEEEL